MTRPDFDECVLILAPSGRDAALAAKMFEAAGLLTHVCEDSDELLRELRAGAGVGVVAAEALSTSSLNQLAEVLSQQPQWSDLSLVILTKADTATDHRKRQLAQLSVLRNATVLERPLRVGVLLNTTTIALQARRRQYQVRDHLIERTRLESELEAAYDKQHRIADTLQQSLLTRPPSNFFPGVRVETLYLPARNEADVGGDFYDIFALDEARIALIIGDVSGKGLVAAARTMETKYAMRAMLRQNPSPDIAMASLNQFLIESHRFDYQAHEGFVCLCVAVLNTVEGKLLMANAAIEPPVLLREDGATTVIVDSGPPLGVIDQAEYPQLSLQLKTGDSLIMITDGITEARSNHDFFGHEGIVDALGQCQPNDEFNTVTQKIVDTAMAYANGHFTDDVCIVAARLEHQTERLPLFQGQWPALSITSGK